MFKKWAYIPALMALFAVLLTARDIFVTPGDSPSNSIAIYQADPLTAVGSVASPAGAFQVVRVSATKFYVISRATVDTVTVYEGSVSSLTQTKRFNLPQPAVAAAVSPDGRRVVVLAGDVYVFETFGDTSLTPTGVNAGASPSSVAIGLDSSRAFVLSPTNQRLTAIDLLGGTVALTATIPGVASQVAAAPNGFIYVTAPNSLIEYDPRTLANNTISLNAFPGSMAFTPDGRGAVLVNTNPTSGASSLIHVDLVRRTFVVAPPVGGAVALDKVVATDNNTAYALTRQLGRVYSVSLTPGGTAPLTLNQVGFGSVAVEGVRDIATSNEVQARYLLASTPVGLFRIESNGTVVGPVTLPIAGNLFVNSPPVTTNASIVNAVNPVQSIRAGQAPFPLVVRVIDSFGSPIAGVPVSFVSSIAGMTIPNATTNNLGLAMTYVDASAVSSGNITVTATATGVVSPASFTLNVVTGDTGGGGTAPGGLQIVSGTGQVLGQFETTATQEPLRVIVRDGIGRVLPGLTLTWSLAQGAGTITPTTSNTDEKGIATANFISSLVSPGQPFQTSNITASTGSETVTFYVNTLANFGSGSRGFLNSYPKQSTSSVIEGRAGETLPAVIQYDVVSSTGARLPFVGIRVETDEKDANGNSVASCRGGTQLSDTDGIAKCDLTLGSFIGETGMTVTVGSVRVDRYTLRITAGRASSIRLVLGNNQTGNPGQQLPAQLGAEVADASGNLLPGVDVQWEVITPGTVTLSQVVNRTDVNGRVSAVATLGQIPGNAQVRIRAGTATATFSLTVSLAAGRLEKQPGGDNQNAVVNQPFSQPLSVLVRDAGGQPIGGAQVLFAVVPGSAGSVSIATPTATTNPQGIATTTVTAGANVGAAGVRASIGTLVETFNLTVRLPGPGFTAASIVNAAGFQPGISPGSIAVINASGIAPNVRGSVTPSTIVGALPTRLADVEVLFNNIPAPIYAVSNVNGQESVNVQVPFEVAPGSASLTINVTGGGSTTVMGVQILPIKPGVFEFIDVNGRRYAVAVRSDGSYVSSTNPARRGEIIRVFATGLGQTTPATGTNRAGLSDQTQSVIASVIAGVNNRGVRVVSAQLQPVSIGVYLVALEIPTDTETGVAAPFALATVANDGSLVFSNGTAIPIQ